MKVLVYKVNGKVAGACSLDKTKWGGKVDIRTTFEVKGDRVVIPDVMTGVEEFEILDDSVLFLDPDQSERLIELS